MRTSSSLKMMRMPLASVIVRVGTERMGGSGKGAAVDMNVASGRRPKQVSKDEPGADLDSWNGGSTVAAHELTQSKLVEGSRGGK